MLIYLDMCSLQRPFDDLAQDRVRAEADAVLKILEFCETGEADLVSSFALEYENDRNPFLLKKSRTTRVLSKAARFIELSPEIERKISSFQQSGIKLVDAAHLACAAEALVDYFCTCDDQLRKRSVAILRDGPPKVLTPVELIKEIGV